MASDRYSLEEFKELVIECLWFCLSENYNRKKIKKDAIVEHCLNKKKKQLDEIIQHVDNLLKLKLGLTLQPVNEDGYILLKNTDFAYVAPNTDEDDNKEKHILWLVIAAIYLNNGQMDEKEMNTFLQTSGLLEFVSISQNEAQSQCSQKSIGGRRFNKKNLSTGESLEFANKYFDKLLKKTFVQQSYLEYSHATSKKSSKNSQIESNVFTLGPRTKACLVEDNLINYINVLKG